MQNVTEPIVLWGFLRDRYTDMTLQKRCSLRIRIKNNKRRGQLKLHVHFVATTVICGIIKKTKRRNFLLFRKSMSNGE